MCSGEELSSAYASADIFMMPSESETLGFVALEAMASGLAVVAVAAGGLVDIITKPGVIGQLSGFPTYDPEFECPGLILPPSFLTGVDSQVESNYLESFLFRGPSPHASVNPSKGFACRLS